MPDSSGSKTAATAASLRTCFALVISTQILNRSPRFWGVLERGTPKYRTKSFVPCGYVAGDSFVNLCLGPCTGGNTIEPRPDRDAFHRLRDGPLYGTLVDMIKETIPELQKLSTADKFALAVELWDELSSNPDEIPVTEEQLNELDRRFEE